MALVFVPLHIRTPNIACGVTLVLQGVGVLDTPDARGCTIRSILELFVLVSVPLDIGNSNFVCWGYFKVPECWGYLTPLTPQGAPAMEHFKIVCSSFLSF